MVRPPSRKAKRMPASMRVSSLRGLSARRYLGGESLEDWAIPITEWKTVRGVETSTISAGRLPM